MFDFDNDKTKEFGKLFRNKDIIGLEKFTDKNTNYKKIYDTFKGRFYFDNKDQFSFSISPDQKTAALICQLHEKDHLPNTSAYNLEILIAKADFDGNFHRTEHIRYDFYDDMSFDELENNSVLLVCTDNPHQKIRRRLRNLPQEMTMSPEELCDVLSKNAKTQKLMQEKAKHFAGKQALVAQKKVQNPPYSNLASWNSVAQKF